MSRDRSLQSGFTLIEVMIALVIVSIALAALSQTIGQFVFNQSGLKERVVATWVAENQLLEIQSGLLKTVDKNKTINMLNGQWRVVLKTENTLIPGLKKAALTVYKVGSNTPITTVTSIVGQ